VAQQQSNDNLISQLLKPLFDRLGLNGAAPLQATQQPRKVESPKQYDEAELRRNGWSERDIQMLRNIGEIRGSSR
jgi:hypothetical protein